MYRRKFYKIRAEIILDYNILVLQQNLTYLKNVWIKNGNVFSGNPCLAKLMIMYDTIDIYIYIYIYTHTHTYIHLHKLVTAYFGKMKFINI
jgi:hypothetical protein